MDTSIIFEALAGLTRWVSPYYAEIAMTIVATVLVIYGDILNKKIKHILAPYHFIVRIRLWGTCYIHHAPRETRTADDPQFISGYMHY